MAMPGRGASDVQSAATTDNPTGRIFFQEGDCSSYFGILFEDCGDLGGGYDAGYIDDGDYLNYIVDAPVAGSYTLNFRLANGYGASRLAIKDSATGLLLAILDVPSTGDFQRYITLSTTAILHSGRQTLSLVCDQPFWNLNWWELIPPGTSSGLLTGANTLHIEAEHYVNHHNTLLEDCSDAGATRNIAYVSQGSYMDYRITMPVAGSYVVRLRVANGGSSSVAEVRQADGTVLAAVAVPNTGSYQVYTTVSATVVLQAGVQTVRVYVQQPYFNFNWLELSAPAGMPELGTYPGYNLNHTFNAYRYGFNGKEKEQDIGEDDYDFGSRIHDARLGRFLSIDSKTNQFPQWSPYMAMGNNPINLVDPDGASPKPAPAMVDAYLRLNMFRYNAFNYAPNSSPQDLNNWARNRGGSDYTMTGILGEYLFMSSVSQDRVPTLVPERSGYGKEIYGPLSSIITADVVRIISVSKYPNGTGGLRTETLEINRNSYDGSIMPGISVSGKSLIPTVRMINYEVKTLSQYAPKDKILENIETGVTQTLINGILPNMTGILVVDKDAWMTLYKDKKYQSVIVGLWKLLDKTGNGVLLVQDLSKNAEKERRKIKQEIKTIPEK